MGKFSCHCGDLVRVSGAIPNPQEWKILSDVDFDAFSGQVDAEALYLACRSMMRCPTCDRLWVYWDGFGADPCYAPQA